MNVVSILAIWPTMLCAGPGLQQDDATSPVAAVSGSKDHRFRGPVQVAETVGPKTEELSGPR